MGESGSPTQLQFQVNGLQFSAQAWGDPNALPVLALHGWLDNSASFSSLAAYLENIYLVALDLAGHGQTSHRPQARAYNIWEDVPDIFAVAEQLGWARFALLGHSRGAIIATLAAGTFPEKISHLALIEGLLPEPVSAEDAPRQLALSIQGSNAQLIKKRTVYPNVELAIKAREHGLFPLSQQAASLLTERGLKKIENGYCWSTDQALLVPSSVKLLPQQMSAFIAQISAPIRLILAEEGMPKIYPRYQAIVTKYPNIDVHTLPGGHHLHMEAEAASVAEQLNVFFKS